MTPAESNYSEGVPISCLAPLEELRIAANKRLIARPLHRLRPSSKSDDSGFRHLLRSPAPTSELAAAEFRALDMNLREYEQNKFAIADILRSACTMAPQKSLDWQERQRDLFARLADDRFNLVCVGRFSRGKTSLMNAILATDRLPTGIVPLTSVITSVGYGTKEQCL
jgi:hypothetical protein